MIKGLYAAASAMLAGVARQNVLAHNVANLDTPGFKQALIAVDDYKQTGVQTRSSGALPARWLGELGLGAEAAPESIDFTDGALKFTGQPLDLALHGPGFFRVETPAGERYTRDGRFLQDVEGQLVTVDGYRVLDDAGQPVTLPEAGAVSFSGDGTIFVDGQETGRLGIVSFDDPAGSLSRSLGNTFEAAGEPDGAEVGVVVQGYQEGANANAAQLMTQMVQVARAYEAAQQMVQNQDELVGKAINTLGRL